MGRFFFTLKVIVLLSFVVPCSLLAQDSHQDSDAEGKKVVVTGTGENGSAKGRDQALDDALRRAVEQGVGVYITSETTVEQMMLVEDRIYSESRGYIREYTIVREGEKNGLYEVQISAVVKMAKLAKDLESIGIIIRKKQNPRIMVVLYSREVDSSFFGVALQGNRNAENQIEGILLAKGFQAVDAGQVKRKKQIEAILLQDDPAMANKLAKDFGAEVLVEGEVRREFAGDRRVMGRSMRFFSNEIRLKAFETDTGKLLFSGFQTRPPSGVEATLPLEEATAKLTAEMISGILEQWRKDVYQASNFQLILSGASYGEMSNVLERVREIRGVGAVTLRSYQSGIAQINVNFKGVLQDLGEKISQLQGPKLEITGLQGNTIDVKLSKSL